MPQVLSTTPTFNPYSLDEILKVPLMVKAEQDKITEDYNKEADKIQQIRNIAILHPEVQPLVDAYDRSFDELTQSLESNNVSDQRMALQRARQGYRDLSQIQLADSIYNERMKPLLAEQAKRPGRFFVDNRYNLQSIMQDPNAIPDTFDLDILEKEAMTYGTGYSNDLGGRYTKGGFDVTYSGMNPDDQNVFRVAMTANNDDDFNKIISAASSKQSRDIMKAMRERLNDMAVNYGYNKWNDQLPWLRDRSMESMLAAMPYKESYSRVPVSSSGEHVGKWKTMVGKDNNIYHWREMGTTGAIEIRNDDNGKPGALTTVDGSKLGPGFTFSGRAGYYNEKPSGSGKGSNSSAQEAGYVMQTDGVELGSFTFDDNVYSSNVSVEALNDSTKYQKVYASGQGGKGKTNIIRNAVKDKYPDITNEDFDIFVSTDDIDPTTRDGRTINLIKDDATFYIRFKTQPSTHVKGYSVNNTVETDEDL